MMFTIHSISNPIKNRKWVTKGIAFAMLLNTWLTPVRGEAASAYATPKEEYIYTYTLEHEYETTLFRSEEFVPILETEEGYIIQLKLGGKPKLVLLPFEGQDRKVAETKYRGVGVTYTAFLTFTEGHLPFDPTQSYEVLKQEKGKLFIDYRINDFQKVVEVPESAFTVKSTFAHQLDESLKLLRTNYRNFEVTESHPTTWKDASESTGPAALTESPTHIALVQNQILANNVHSTRTAPASDLLETLTEVWIDNNRLVVVPVDYTYETAEGAFYFVKMRGYDRPVLIKDLKRRGEAEAYYQVVKVPSKSGQTVRFLEVTESMDIEFYPDFHFLLRGNLAAVRKGIGALYLKEHDGEYEIPESDVRLFSPEAFMQWWHAETVKDLLNPADRLYSQFINFNIPPVANGENNWKSLRKLQDLVELNHNTQTFDEEDARNKVNALNSLETGAIRLGLSLKVVPKLTQFPIQNACYFDYWKKAFEDVNRQAAKESNQKVLKYQILRSKILVGETNYQALIDFLSNQIYTYSNFIPAPLNRINQLESNPPLAASKLITFDFPVSYTFKLNPDTLETIGLQPVAEVIPSPYRIKTEYNKPWILETDALQFWQTQIIAKKEEVYDPAYRQSLEERAASEKQKKQEIARKRLAEAQAVLLEQNGQLKNSKLPWIAAGAWFALLLLTNTGFFALSKVMPIRHS